MGVLNQGGSRGGGLVFFLPEGISGGSKGGRYESRFICLWIFKTLSMRGIHQGSLFGRGEGGGALV